MGSMQQTAEQNYSQHAVVVAAVDIPARAQITADMIVRVVKPAWILEPDTIEDPNKAIGSVALINIPSKAALTASKIGRPNDLGLPVQVTSGMRAVTISIDKVKGIAGLIEPGDRVDVMSIPPGSAPDGYATTILRGLRVLAVGTTIDSPSATPGPQDQNSTTVTLEVTPRQGELLANADATTSLRLALRSPKEPIRSLPVGRLPQPAVFQMLPAIGGAALPPPAPVQAVVPTQAPRFARVANSPKPGIQIIDGDRLVQP